MPSEGPLPHLFRNLLHYQASVTPHRFLTSLLSLPPLETFLRVRLLTVSELDLLHWRFQPPSTVSMSHRYSRAAKEKWAANSLKPPHRPPVVIPSSDNTKLIEENKLTLIGRVTNPTVQKTRALVDFFTQHWSTVDDFSAMIPFWIRVHDLPLNFWNEPTPKTIGEELGVVETRGVDHGRVRVLINGRKPLEMHLDISLPSVDIKKVELEYEMLEKHCFNCHLLSHENSDCLNRAPPRDHRADQSTISQTRSLDRLEDARRRCDDRRGERDYWNCRSVGRLQNVEIHYLEETFPNEPVEGNSIPSSSRAPIQSQLSLPQVSHIRSLSKDRRHVFERLGNTSIQGTSLNLEEPVPAEAQDQDSITLATMRAASKAAGKHKVVEKSSTRKRNSPKRRGSSSSKQQQLDGQLEVLMLPRPRQSFQRLLELRLVFGPPKSLFLSCFVLELLGHRKQPYTSLSEGDPTMEDRAAFWEKLMLIAQHRDEAWLISGDYNELLDHSEKERGPPRWEGSFVAFRRFVTQAGLWDVPFTGNPLSWRDIRYNHLIHSRLDRVMANRSWSEAFSAAHCKYLRFEGSDHRPLIVFFDRSRRKRWAPSDPDLIARLSATLTEAYAEEESFWRQRSRIQWLQNGDRNTGFFRAVTRGRNAMNKMSVIENEAGEAVYGDEKIS
ncbi:hypothetical protein Bca4012_065332 [Brassica carinata]